MRTSSLYALAFMTGLIGCGSALPTEASGADGGSDAGTATGGGDAGRDAGTASSGGDAGSDAGAVEGPLRLRITGDAFRLGAGGTVTIPVTVTRSGAVGDVTVTVSGAPAGISAAPLVIPAAATSGMLTLSAASTATPGAASITVRGTSSGATGDAAVTVAVAPRPGSLDTSLRGTGIAIDAAGPAVYTGDAVLDAEGRILVMDMRGDTMAIELRRYSADGTLDRSFDGDGVATVSAEPMLRLGRSSIVVRGDGSILVAYSVGTSGAITAFDASGARLRGYGEANETQTLSMADVGAAVNATFVVRSGALTYGVAWAGMSTRVCRLTVGGAVDPTFGMGGFVTVSSFAASDVAVDAMGRIVLAGALNQDAGLVRLTPAGALDTTFAGDGSTSVPSGGPDFYFSVQPLSDGRIAALVELGRNTLRVHAETSGAPDPSFAMGGIQAFPVGSYPRLAEVNGDVVLVGFTDGGYDIYRMSRTNGALRTDFDSDGIARVNVAAGRTLSSGAVRVDAQGRMTIVGTSSPDGFSPGQIVMTRVWM